MTHPLREGLLAGLGRPDFSFLPFGFFIELLFIPIAGQSDWVRFLNPNRLPGLLLAAAQP